MPTDHAAQSVTIDAPLDKALATIRDVESQPSWVTEIVTAELLTRNADGTPATAHFTATTPVGKDDYVLAYQHGEDGMSWTLVRGRLQSAQQGRYTLRDAGQGRTQVTFELTITHPLPLPGFIRNRVIKGLVHSTVSGLQGYLEG